MTATKTYYLIRIGWNAANQSVLGRPAKPKNEFESGRLALVAIVESASADDAKKSFEGTVYPNQHLSAETNPRAIAGLTREIREFSREPLSD